MHNTVPERVPAQETSPEPESTGLHQAEPRGGGELLTQLVGGCDNVSGNTRVQIGVHDAEGVQLGHVVPSDLQGATTAQSPPGTRGEGEGGRGGVGGRVWR